VVVRLRIGVWCASLAVVVEGCTAVLGLDAPTLDPCPDECSDAHVIVEASLDDAGISASVDAATPFDASADTAAISDASPEASQNADVLVQDAGQGAGDVAAEAAAVDAGPGRDSGTTTQGGRQVLCGFASPDGPQLYCARSGMAATICCQTADDAGQSSFECVNGASACAGYPIECADDVDCPGQLICCHRPSGMTCEEIAPSGTCATGTQACDPHSADTFECPSGTSCVQALTNSGLTSPYLGCQ
jgi:hypothetical protein